VCCIQAGAPANLLLLLANPFACLQLSDKPAPPVGHCMLAESISQLSSEILTASCAFPALAGTAPLTAACRKACRAGQASSLSIALHRQGTASSSASIWRTELSTLAQIYVNNLASIRDVHGTAQ